MWKWLKSWFVRKPVEVPVVVKAPFVRPLTPFEDAYNRAKLSGDVTVNLPASPSSAARSEAEIVLAAVYGIGGVGGGGWLRADDTGRKNIQTPSDMSFEDQAIYTHIRKSFSDAKRASLFRAGGMQKIHEAILAEMANLKNKDQEKADAQTQQEEPGVDDTPIWLCGCRQAGKTEAVDLSIKQKAMLEALDRVKKQVYASDEASILARNAERARQWAEHESQKVEAAKLDQFYQFLQAKYAAKDPTPDPSAPPPRRQQTSGGEVGVDAPNVEGTAPDVGVPPMDGRSGTQ